MRLIETCLAEQMDHRGSGWCAGCESAVRLVLSFGYLLHVDGVALLRVGKGHIWNVSNAFAMLR